MGLEVLHDEPDLHRADLPCRKLLQDDLHEPWSEGMYPYTEKALNPKP